MIGILAPSYLNFVLQLPSFVGHRSDKPILILGALVTLLRQRGEVVVIVCGIGHIDPILTLRLIISHLFGAYLFLRTTRIAAVVIGRVSLGLDALTLNGCRIIGGFAIPPRRHLVSHHFRRTVAHVLLLLYGCPSVGLRGKVRGLSLLTVHHNAIHLHLLVSFKVETAWRVLGCLPSNDVIWITRSNLIRIVLSLLYLGNRITIITARTFNLLVAVR